MKHQNQLLSSQKKNFLSADPNKAMQEMMDVIDRMRGVYVRETEALEDMDTKGFIALQDEKIQATNIYKSGVEDILRRKCEMKAVNPALKRDLERMQADFAALSSKNMDALKRMQRTMERLGQTVQRAAKESVNKQRAFSYGESGKIHNDERKSVSIGVSETA
ncbi:MAG TPA: flagellar protein FlgN [Alphaproteobacteria bacterium]|nr:flagellar protein FlgN [Alphaproteobacteria bacterium]USO04665.1 MAG: flagellar protein FlgN [Rhodospirillales bacterium]HOO82286.1 flagellar protein FlgN [Alphaproteobacteria bacterium]